MRVVGTVELLQMRVYPHDPDQNACDLNTATVAVQPGEFALYEEDGYRFWLMVGNINKHNEFEKIDHGLFVLHRGDNPDGPEVTFRSPKFSLEEWADFANNDPLCVEGPDQRLKVREF